jgi:DNA-binding CsgD family transcriptional regulator
MSSLVERDSAIAELERLLAGAANKGHVTLVTGEAGIGKSSMLRAVAEVAERHLGTRVWWGNCDALETPMPLAPLRDIARQHGVRFARKLGDSRPVLFEAVLDELRFAEQPLLVVVEDVHWADEATLDLLKFLGRRIESTHALLAISFRDDELSASHPLRRLTGELPSVSTTRLSLAPLSPQGVEVLARRALRLPSRLHAVTQGNPFFLMELLRHPSVEMPATVQDLVLSRFARLDAPAQALVRLVSVVPGRMESSLLERLGADLDAMETCLHSGLLVAQDSNFSFRHELARVAVETSLPQPVARALHARVLAALENTTPAPSAALLAHHAALARNMDALARYAPAAAEEARRQGASREAAQHLQSVLRNRLGSEEERRQWLETFAIYSANIDWHADAMHAREELDTLHAARGDVAARGANLSRLALLHMYMMRNDDAEAASRRAIELLETLPPGRELATAYGVAASLRLRDRDIAVCLEWGRKSLELAEACGDRVRAGYSMATMGCARMFRDFGRGTADLLQVLAQVRGDGDLVAEGNALLNLGSAAVELMRLDHARVWLQEGIARMEACALDNLVYDCAGAMTTCDYQAARYAQAVECASPLAERTDITAAPRFAALLALARSRIRTGEDGASETLATAAELLGSGTPPQHLAPLWAARAEIASSRGELAALVPHLQQALDVAVAREHAWCAGEIAFWLWRGGALTDPPAICAEPYALQIAGKWCEAAAAWEQLGCPFEQARALADGDRDAMQQALAIFEQIGARPAAQELRRHLREQGLRGIARGAHAATRSRPFGLTGREMQVLELLCRGLRNAEIAARLSRSVRTVDHHLAAVFAKLGVDSRFAAIQAAQRAGIGDERNGQRKLKN